MKWVRPGVDNVGTTHVGQVTVAANSAAQVVTIEHGRRRLSEKPRCFADGVATDTGRVWMSAYRTVVVGTDGSDSSLRAVDRAGQIAAGANAKLIVATAYFPQSEDQRAADVLKDEGYQAAGNAPIYAILREATDRAKAAGATDVEERPVVGAPVDALVELAEDVKADLLVVGNVGLSTIAGRLLGSVPANVARRSKTDVLIVHTS